MALPDPDNTQIEPVVEDSGVLVRDTENAPVSTWQMLVTGLLVIAILVVFFYGLTEQRTEVAGLNPPKPNIAAPAGTGQQTSDKTTTTKTGPAQATAPASPEGGQTTGAAPSKK